MDIGTETKVVYNVSLLEGKAAAEDEFASFGTMIKKKMLYWGFKRILSFAVCDESVSMSLWTGRFQTTGPEDSLVGWFRVST